MATRSLRMQRIKGNTFRHALNVLRSIFEPSATVEAKKRRSLRLVSAFLILMAINTLIGAIIVKNTSNSLWVIMLATSTILVVGYGLSRTRYFKLAMAFAISIPAIPILAMILFGTNRADIPNELPWLALPLLVCSLLLSLRYTIIIAIIYTAFIALLIPFVDIPTANLSQSLSFMFMIFFFVVAVTATRQQDQSEIENQLTERRRAEEKLRESEEKFSKAFHASPDIIAITTLKDGKIIEVNDSFTRVTGYNREDVTGHNAIELDLWPKSEQRDKIYKKLREKGQINQEEFDMRNRAGEIRTGLFSAEPINIGGEPCIISVITDITERKRAEEALRESEEKFSKAFRSSPNTMVITTLKDGKFIEVNDSHNRISGYSREETIGQSALELGLWIKAEDRTRMIQILKEHGRVQNEEFAFRMKSGEIRTWLLSAEPINIGGEPCVISMTIDITELKRAEKALRESEEKYRAIFEQAADSIAVIDTETGALVDFNTKAHENLGYGREEFAKLKLNDIDTFETTEEFRRHAKNIQKEGIECFEAKHRTKSGETRDVQVSNKTLNIRGKIFGFAVWHDITERKAAEEKLKKALSNLEHSSAQLAAINKEMEAFSYSVSHDLRAPLRSIDGFSQALLEDYLDKLDKQGQDYLNRLRSASQKMGELIDGLLKLSRLTRSDMHKEKIDLSALAEEITTRLKETQPERQVEVVISRGLTASGDRQLLRALLENLLGNAWKFTGKCPQARIEFGATQNGAKKAYFVRDNGAGFDMTYADKLFGAFQRLHEVTEFPGTGIGLATVQRIIHRHGGSVWAEGTVGKGATFYFTLN